MKKIGMIMMIAALSAGMVQAAEVSASVDFASAYVFRGTTLNDGLVMQPGFEVSGLPIPEEYGALAFGTWANYDIGNYDGFLADGEFSEIDYYLSYTLPVEALDVGVGYCEYTYPGAAADADRELSLSLGTPIGTNGLYASVAFNYGIDGAIGDQLYTVGALEYGVDVTEELSVSAGISAAYVNVDQGSDGFADGTASVGASYALGNGWAINGSLTYVAQLDNGVLAETGAGEPNLTGTVGYDVPVYGMLGVSCDF